MRHPFPMGLVLDGKRPPGRSAREHVSGQLRAAILSGQASAHEPLPSSRVLASALGVSRGTVVSAYEELAGEGYVDVIPGSGTYVTTDLPSPPPSSRARSLTEPVGIETGGTETVETEPADASEPERTTRTLNLSPGSPAAGLHRDREWNSAWRKAARQDMPDLPPPAAGDEGFRAAIADHLRAARGVQCTADDLVVTAGASDGIGLLVHALRSQGADDIRIASENPGHRASRAVISRLGATPVPIPVRDGGMDIDRLEGASGPLAAALLTPSHQYPLGGRLPVASRLALLDWATTTGTLIIEDDYDSEFRHGAPSLPAIASLDGEGRVVLLGTFSKTLSPWLRCGYLLIPDRGFRAQVLEARTTLGQPVSGMVQTALTDFLRAGGLRRHLVRVGREYAHRRRLVIDAMSDLPPQFRLDALEGGLHATLSWDGGESDETAVEALARSGIEVAPLSSSHHDPAAPVWDGIVFGYGASTALELRSALRTIRDTLASIRG